MNIIPSTLLEPEFYEIADWNNARASAVPRWLSVWFLYGQAIAHPTVIEKLMEEAA